MPRNKSSIQVELHLHESPEEMQAIQRIFSSTLCSCIAKKLENSNLTVDEKKYVVERIAEQLGKDNSLPALTLAAFIFCRKIQFVFEKSVSQINLYFD